MLLLLYNITNGMWCGGWVLIMYISVYYIDLLYRSIYIFSYIKKFVRRYERAHVPKLGLYTNSCSLFNEFKSVYQTGGMKWGKVGRMTE